MRSARSAARVAVHFVLWPIVAVAFIRGWLTNYLKPAENGLEQKIADIRSQIEYLAFGKNLTASVFDFREVFTRFTGLTMVLMESGKVTSSMDLLKMSGQKNISLASACLDRRNRQRLLFHQKQACSEFVEVVAALAARSNNKEIGELGQQLADLLNDQQTANDLAPSGLALQACNPRDC